MTATEYESWRRENIASYAEENVALGRWTEAEAMSRSEREFANLLPGGISTADNYLCSIVDQSSSERVGVIWYALRHENGRGYIFVYAFEILEEYRRKGYGTQALLHLEDVVREMGLSLIALRVFGRNRAARDLYTKSGYEETDVLMSKKVS